MVFKTLSVGFALMISVREAEFKDRHCLHYLLPMVESWTMITEHTQNPCHIICIGSSKRTLFLVDYNHDAI